LTSSSSPVRSAPASYIRYCANAFEQVIGTLFTASSTLFFALINPHTIYWASGFPSTIFSVIGADFMFASGTLFVAKVAFPHEQSVAGALFNTMTQLGTSFGLTISTIVYDRVREAHNSGDLAAAQLAGYRAAQWTCFGFGIFATLLAALFLHGVGAVGHSQPAEERITDMEKETKGKSSVHVKVQE
jgi:hypothetical protein